MFKIVQIFVLTLEVKTGIYKNKNKSTLIKRRYYSMYSILQLRLFSKTKTGNMQTNKNV